MRKVFIIIFLSIILLSCEEHNFIEIGVVGSMTGAQSELSVSGRRGIELAVAELNDLDGLLGKEIILVVKDDFNDKQRSKEIAEEFSKENIELVIGPFMSSMMLSAYDIIHENELLYISPTVASDDLNAIDDQFIRFIASAKNQGKVLGEAAKKYDKKRFAVIADSKNKEFYNELYDSFNEELESSSGQIFSLIEYENLKEFKHDELTKVIENNMIEGILILSNASDFASIAQHVIKYDSNISFYGSLWSHANEVIRLGGKNVEGSIMVSGISNETKYEKFNEVSSKYYKRYGEPMSFASMYSYETMMALGQAIKNANSSNWRDIKKELIKIDSFRGLQAEYIIDKYGDSTRPYFISQIIDGGFITIESK